MTSHLFVHERDRAAQDRDARSVDGRKAAITKALEDLRRMHPDDRVLLDRLAAVRGQYVAIFGRAIERSRAETVAGAADRSGSRAIYNEQVLPAKERLDKVVDETVEKVTEDVEVAEKHIAATSASAKRTLIIAALIAVAFAIALSIVITLSVTRPLGVVLERLNMLREKCITDLGGALRAQADGDLTVEITPVTPLIEDKARDEMGALARTVDAIRN